MYIDCKLHVDTKFTPAQDEIVKNLNRDIVINRIDNGLVLDGYEKQTFSIGQVLKLATDDSSLLILK